MKYKSVTLLAADNPNLGEYLAQLEAEQARLQARIKELVEQLRRAGGRCEKCGYYFPGHATGGAYICTCL